MMMIMMLMMILICPCGYLPAGMGQLSNLHTYLVILYIYIHIYRVAQNKMSLQTKCNFSTTDIFLTKISGSKDEGFSNLKNRQLEKLSKFRLSLNI